MASVAIHVAVAIGDASVTEKKGDLVGCLTSKGDEVPEHIWVLEVGLWISFLCVDKAWEENWVTDEENWCVVANQIPDPILKVHEWLISVYKCGTAHGMRSQA